MTKAKKYEIIHDDKTQTKNLNGELIEIYRIKALKSFIDAEGNIVKKGAKGGYIETESSLSQEGSCWVADGSIVADGAYVYDDALVKTSRVYGAYVAGKAIIEGSYIIGKNTKIEGTVIQSTVADDSRVRENALIKNSNIIDGAKIGKNDAEAGIAVTIAGSTIRKSYVTGNSVIIDSEVETRYKLVDVSIEGSVLVDEYAETAEKVGVSLKNKKIVACKLETAPVEAE